MENFSTIAFDLIIEDFDLLKTSFSSQMIMGQSISHWAQIGFSRDHFILFTCGILEFGGS